MFDYCVVLGENGLGYFGQLGVGVGCISGGVGCISGGRIVG